MFLCSNEIYNLQKPKLCSCSNNVNTTIRKHSFRAFVWVVTPLDFIGRPSSGFRGFLGLVKFVLGSESVKMTGEIMIEGSLSIKSVAHKTGKQTSHTDHIIWHIIKFSSNSTLIHSSLIVTLYMYLISLCCLKDPLWVSGNAYWRKTTKIW